jgi:hypothetical protein
MNSHFETETVERAFIRGLENVKKLEYEEIVSRLQKVIKLCKEVTNIKSILFAFYDLYFTQLIILQAPFSNKQLEQFNIIKKKVREVNRYAKLVEIFNENPTENQEPPNKIQKKEQINLLPIKYDLLSDMNIDSYINSIDNQSKNKEPEIGFNLEDFEKVISEI